MALAKALAMAPALVLVRVPARTVQGLRPGYRRRLQPCKAQRKALAHTWGGCALLPLLPPTRNTARVTVLCLTAWDRGGRAGGRAVPKCANRARTDVRRRDVVAALRMLGRACVVQPPAEHKVPAQAGHELRLGTRAAAHHEKDKARQSFDKNDGVMLLPPHPAYPPPVVASAVRSDPAPCEGFRNLASR